MMRTSFIFFTILHLALVRANELNTDCTQSFGTVNSDVRTELVLATFPSDATNLIQTRYGFSLSDPIFSRVMGKAVNDTVQEIKLIDQRNENITSEKIRSLMLPLAKARNEIANEKKQVGAIRFGLPLPETHNELESFCRKTGDNIPLLDAGYILDRIDRDGHGELDRNRELYALAERALQERPTEQPFQIELGGKNRDLSALVETEPGTIVAVHPSFKDMIELRLAGLKSLEFALNNRQLNETELLNELAKGYALLMHAPPYYRGSPSIVEGFIDAIIRARLGKTLPLKTAEPFWDVIFNFKGNEPYTAAHFLRNYRN